MAKKKKPIIKLMGNMADEVTGSMTLIETSNGKQLALEMGIIQGQSTIEEDYKKNLLALTHIDVKKLDYIFVDHFHGDHCFLIPYAVKRGFNGKIICPKNSKAFLKPMLLDCAFINERTVNDFKFKYKKEFELLYGEDEVYQTLDMIYEYDFDKIVILDDEISFKFLRNSHMVGASSLELFITDKSSHKYKIFYSSDIGNLAFDRPYVDETEKCTKANICIFENTYSGRLDYYTNKDRKKEIKELKKIIIQTVLGQNGNVIMPVFASNRCQEIMTILYDLFNEDERFNKIDFIVDSKLAKRLCEVYSEVLEDDNLEKWNKVVNWKNFKIISDYQKETLEVLKDSKPKVILSCAGMMTFGHIISYVEKYIDKSKNTIIMTGYASENSLAGQLRLDDSTIKIGKNTFDKKATIVTLKCFSGHIQHKDLLNYITSINCDKVILVHGDIKGKKIMQECCDKKFREINKTTQVIVGKKGMNISF